MTLRPLKERPAVTLVVWMKVRACSILPFTLSFVLRTKICMYVKHLEDLIQHLWIIQGPRFSALQR